MNYWPIISSVLLGMGIVLLLVPLILKAAASTNLFQRGQDFHHTHQKPIPRVGGGLALVAAFVGVEILVAAIWPEERAKAPERSAVFASSLAMFTLWFWDDLKPLGAKWKLFGKILIAVAVCAFGIGIQRLKIPFASTVIELHGWGVLITVFWLVGMTNLINLID